MTSNMLVNLEKENDIFLYAFAAHILVWGSKRREGEQCERRSSPDSRGQNDLKVIVVGMALCVY